MIFIFRKGYPPETRLTMTYIRDNQDRILNIHTKTNNSTIITSPTQKERMTPIESEPTSYEIRYIDDIIIFQERSIVTSKAPGGTKPQDMLMYIGHCIQDLTNNIT